jgi:gas vesicle protein
MESKFNKLEEVNIGDFVKFVDKDKKGKIEYIGEVLSKNDFTNTIEIDCPEGFFGFIVDKNDLYKTEEKPTNWDRYKKNPENYRKLLKEKEIKKDFAPTVKTLKEQIKEFVEQNKLEKESKLIKLAMKTFNGDSTTIENYVRLFKSKI